VAEIDVPGPGTWTAAVVARTASQPAVGTQPFSVVSAPLVDPLGAKAVSVRTPVARSEHALKEVCTRTPPDHMHYISLDRALRSRKPTVVVFATPLLCESRLCGPVVDEVLIAFTDIEPHRANFIHVEEFLPGPDLKPPPATLETRSPAFKAWRLKTEPWVFVLDRDGVIRARLGPGPCVASEIEAALKPFL